MNIWLLHHASDAAFAATLKLELERRGFPLVPGAEGAELALLLVSRAALEIGRAHV